MLPKQYKCKGFRFNISIPLFLDHVITYLACLRVHVQTCLACLSAHVPTYLACLRAHVPTCLLCLHAYDPMCLPWYVLTCQRALSAYVSHMSTWLACLHVSKWLVSSYVHIPTCLESLVSHCLSDHVITGQHALPV